MEMTRGQIKQIWSVLIFINGSQQLAIVNNNY